MDKKIIIGVIVLIIGVISMFVIPGGFTKDKIIEKQTMAIQLEQPKSVEKFDPLKIPLSEPLSRTPLRAPLLTAPVTEPVTGLEEPIPLKSVEMSIPYEVGKTIYQEIFGMVKDLLSLVTTIIGILVALKGLAAKKKEEAAKAKA